MCDAGRRHAQARSGGLDMRVCMAFFSRHSPLVVSRPLASSFDLSPRLPGLADCRPHSRSLPRVPRKDSHGVANWVVAGLSMWRQRWCPRLPLDRKPISLLIMGKGMKSTERGHFQTSEQHDTASGILTAIDTWERRHPAASHWPRGMVGEATCNFFLVARDAEQ